MNILVTGGAGMIGSALVKSFLVQQHNVVVIDNFWRGSESNLKFALQFNSSFKLIKADLRDHVTCVSLIKEFDFVYHLADIVSGINFVFDNELFLWRSNLLINSNVIDACKQNGISNVVYVGTACSYPKERQAHIGGERFVESDVFPASPESSYGWSKLMGEYEFGLAANEGAFNLGILRLHNVYGFPCELNPQRSQVIPALCRKIVEAKIGHDLEIWGSGEQRRSFIYIDDVIVALHRIAERAMGKGSIQVGSEHSISIKTIAEKLVKISGKELILVFDRSKPEGDKDRRPDCSLARSLLDWKPAVSIDEGLQRTYEWCECRLNELSK